MHENNLEKNIDETMDNSSQVSENNFIEVQELEQKLQNEKEKFLRIIADYDNQMKRTKLDATHSSNMIVSNLVKDLVPVIEDLSAASKIASLQVQEGISLIIKNFKKIFFKYGIEEISPKIGDKFDVEHHQAISSKQSELNEGLIVEILKIGYKFKNHVITPAIVITAS